jgi:hypothetical protein
MEFVAQTNLQLYNQLRRRGSSDDELRLVRAAYELACILYSGYFSADRRPFVAHVVGVASILASVGQPARMVAAGALHNVYGNGDFGDGLHNAAPESRRRRVRETVGSDVEDIVYRFHLRRVRPMSDDGYRERLERLAQTDIPILLLDLADALEKYVDGSVLYHGDGSWISDPVDRHGEFLVGLARRIGQPGLATALEQSFAEVAADPGLPMALRGSEERKHRTLVIPGSCRRRLYPVLAETMLWLVRPSGWGRTLRRYWLRFTRPMGF